MIEHRKNTEQTLHEIYIKMLYGFGICVIGYVDQQSAYAAITEHIFFSSLSSSSSRIIILASSRRVANVTERNLTRPITSVNVTLIYRW